LIAQNAGMAAVSGERSRSSALAWALGLGGALACTFTLGLTIALGLFSPQAVVFLIFIASGLLGAIVASREPSNSVGWLMCAGSLAGVMLALPLDYGYLALVVEHGSWPLGGTALWLEAWGWSPLIGMFFSMITLRFPDGRVPPRWRIVDWLAVAGTVVFALSLALAPPSVLSGFQFLSSAQAFQLLAPHIHNPLDLSLPVDLLGQVRLIGLVMILLAGVGSVASVVGRFRRSTGVERLQLKWFAYSGVLVGVGFVYLLVALVFLKQSYGDANLPLDAAAFSLPIAIGIAILRYHLYDIDLIINRTLVYAILTAILGGVYVAGIEFTQRLFVFYTGQRSDTAIVIMVFAVATLFTPVQKWAEGAVERRLGGRSPAERLEMLASSVEEIIRVIDPHRIARWLVDESVRSFEADGGELYLEAHHSTEPFHVAGHITGRPALEVAVRHGHERLGRLLLGHRRKSFYSERDRAAIQRSADVLGEALTVADLGRSSQQQRISR
jgi:hypothetical protein